jgi:hypothetical protein
MRGRSRRLRLDDDLRERPVTSSTFSSTRDALDEVAVLHDAAHLGEDRHANGSQVGEQGARLALLAVVPLELGAVDEVVRSRSRPVSSTMTSSPWRFITTSEPSLRWRR